MADETDVEFQRGLLTRKMEAGEDVVMETNQAAVLRNVDVPKAKYHFVVLPKEDIVNVTALTRKHLDLLDHMLELAVQTIEQQTQLQLSNFLIGFKMDAFMNRLNMHVISKDFCADTMSRNQHWNTFNTELFITFQTVHALINFKGFIEPMSPERAESLRKAFPVQCNQCSFKTGNFPKFKDHLEYHWQRKQKYQTNLSESMAKMNLNGSCMKKGPQCGPRPQGFRPHSQRGSTEVNQANPNPYRKFSNNQKKSSPQTNKSNGDNSKNISPN
ncbi:hypothetical protein KR215_012136 [Drosophila sulfurigaster]|nr:hypothetical protein KR215_012136 [Drosophila sulfurigaster]